MPKVKIASGPSRKDLEEAIRNRQEVLFELQGAVGKKLSCYIFSWGATGFLNFGMDPRLIQGEYTPEFQNKGELDLPDPVFEFLFPN